MSSLKAAIPTNEVSMFKLNIDEKFEKDLPLLKGQVRGWYTVSVDYSRDYTVVNGV